MTLTLFVGVRIPIPQPKMKPPIRVVFIFGEKGKRDSNKEGAIAEENNLNGCFRRRGNERKRGDRCGSTETKSLPLRQKKRLVETSRFFNEIRLTANEIASL